MTVFRDTGPYSARNSSKGALIAEAGRVIEGLRSGQAAPETVLQEIEATAQVDAADVENDAGGEAGEGEAAVPTEGEGNAAERVEPGGG